MKIGIIAGGFKPLTSGHFAKIALSDSECDKTLLLYSKAGRSSGGGSEIKPRQLKKMWNMLVPELHSIFGDSLIIKDASPWPVSAVYGIIKCASRSLSHPIESEKLRAKSFLRNFGIEDTISHITVYASEEDLHKRFISYIENGDAIKIFDSTYDDGKLSFSNGNSRILEEVKRFYPRDHREDIIERINIRGTAVRRAILSGDISRVAKFIPPVFNDHSRVMEFIDIFRSEI